jgi:hypothetical protein
MEEAGSLLGRIWCAPWQSAQRGTSADADPKGAWSPSFIWDSRSEWQLHDGGGSFSSWGSSLIPAWQSVQERLSCADPLRLSAVTCRERFSLATTVLPSALGRSGRVAAIPESEWH